jgi:multiple sugar transport system substrate-binding protein
VTQARVEGDITWCIGKDTTGAFSTVVDNFNKANPDANAELLELPTAADETAPAPGPAPAGGVARVRRARHGRDLDGRVRGPRLADGRDRGGREAKGRVHPLDARDGKVRRQVLGHSLHTNAGFIYWRTDQAGDQPPETWEAMYQTARQENGLVYQGARYEGLTVNFLELLYSAGGNVVNEDATEATADSQETRDVLEFMRKGIEDGAVPKAVTTYMEEESRRAFEAGNATFMRNWPYACALGKESKIAYDFAVTTFPSYAGNQGAGVLGGYDLAISAYSQNPEGALAFANFATSPEAQVIQASKASLPAVLTQVYDDPQVQKALPFASELRQAVGQAKPRPVSPVYPQISEAIYNNVFAALQGDMSPDEAASTMNDEIQEALEIF